MKRLLLIVVAICFAFMAKAQIPPEKLLGTWTLIKYDYGNGNTGDQTITKFKRTKTFTTGHFTMLDYDTAGRVIKKAIYGSYHINLGRDTIPGKSKISEYFVASMVQPSSDEQEFWYAIKLDEDDLLYQSVDFPGVKWSEVWMRVKETTSPRRNSKKPDEIVVEKLFGEKTHPLLFIKTETGEKRIKPNKNYPLPFAAIPVENIAMVTLIGDEEAIQKYGMDGRFGVIILKVIDRYLPTALTQLRKQKNID